MTERTPAHPPPQLERETIRRIWLRIIPLLIPVTFFAFLDRMNLGFAAVTMNHDLGLTNTQFGTAAGFFAIGYALFGIPSTLMLHRIGARRWISFTMIVWGLCSAATAFVTRPGELLAVRLLLGMAEAGLAPGTVLYLSGWFPSDYRGRVLGSFFVINPVSQLIGGPLSSMLLSADGVWGLAGWQWLFLVEALPTLLLAVAVFQGLTDEPEGAHWLSSEEKHWLATRLARPNADEEPTPIRAGFWQALSSGRVWLLTAAGVALGTSGIGTVVFLPLIIRSMGFSVWHTGFIAAIPAALAAVTLPLWGVWADRVRSREHVVVAGCVLLACGLSGAAALLPSPWAIVPLSVALAAFFGCLSAFWTLPTQFLSGAAAAAGIALINMLGNLGQFAGPFLLGHLSDLTRSYSSGLAGLAVIAVAAAAILAVRIPVRGKLAQPPCA